jgi:hypothetical protein
LGDGNIPLAIAPSEMIGHKTMKNECVFAEKCQNTSLSYRSPNSRKDFSIVGIIVLLN